VGIRATLGTRHLGQRAAPLTPPALELAHQAAADAPPTVRGGDRDGREPEPAGAVVEEGDGRGAREAEHNAAVLGDDDPLIRSTRGECRPDPGLVGRVAQIGNEFGEGGLVAGPGVADLGRRLPQ
jgi:hypothetical protein